jgi:hypothetical protein
MRSVKPGTVVDGVPADFFVWVLGLGHGWVYVSLCSVMRILYDSFGVLSWMEFFTLDLER